MRSFPSVLLMFFLLSFVHGTVYAQESDWTELTPAASPSERHYHDMAYDTESDRVILFGGQQIGRPHSDETWAYDLNRNSWTLMNPATSPSARFMHAMAYDAESDRVILFGGIFKEQPETWAYDFNADAWTNVTPAVQPTGYVVAGMAYDAESDRIVLFGGDTDNAFLHNSLTDETWAYDFNANTWSKMSQAESPGPRGGHGMAYDAASDRIIMFGGGRGTTNLGDTWAYDFNTNSWQEMDPSNAPISRHEPGMAYDGLSDRVVLFGGVAGQDETWVYDYDNDAWSQVEKGKGPDRRRVSGLTYDSESERVILFGGVQPTTVDQFFGDTWMYRFTLPPPPPPPPPWVLLVIGVAAGVVAVVAVSLLRKRRLQRE